MQFGLVTLDIAAQAILMIIVLIHAPILLLQLYS